MPEVFDDAHRKLLATKGIDLCELRSTTPGESAAWWKLLHALDDDAFVDAAIEHLDRSDEEPFDPLNPCDLERPEDSSDAQWEALLIASRREGREARLIRGGGYVVNRYVGLLFEELDYEALQQKYAGADDLTIAENLIRDRIKYVEEFRVRGNERLSYRDLRGSRENLEWLQNRLHELSLERQQLRKLRKLRKKRK
jgi:hypothetical protein